MTPTPKRRRHLDACEAEADHPLDCATATELARLRAFAEAIRDEVFATCPHGGHGCGDVDDCWHCYATQALERAR